MRRLTFADVDPTPLARALPLLTSVVSPLTGLLPALRALPRRTGDARFVTVVSAGGESQAAGASLDDAVAAAIGAGLERYAGAYVDEDRVRYASADALGNIAAAPASFALFHPRQYARPQFGFVPFEGSTRLRWTPAFRLPDGEPAFVPTQLTGLGKALHGEPRIGYATRSGLACAVTFEEAVVRGLFELVAHDAAMIAWYNRHPLARISFEDDASLAAEVRRAYGATGLRFSVLDLTPFAAVPAALAVVRDARGETLLAAGVAGASTLAGAVSRALRNAFATRVFARDAGERGHTVTPVNARAAAFLDASPERVALASAAPLTGGAGAQMTAVVARLARSGVDVYAVDLTPPDVRCAGLRVAAVIAPQLCRLGAHDRCPYLGGRRLARAAYELGRAPRPQTFDDLNPFAHPLL